MNPFVRVRASSYFIKGQGFDFGKPVFRLYSGKKINTMNPLPLSIPILHIGMLFFLQCFWALLVTQEQPRRRFGCFKKRRLGCLRGLGFIIQGHFRLLYPLNFRVWDCSGGILRWLFLQQSLHSWQAALLQNHNHFSPRLLACL